MVGDPATFGILTVSDRANSGEYEDEGGGDVVIVIVCGTSSIQIVTLP